jgi:hypothetical protein
METVVADGPLVQLAANEDAHRFRVRICDGEADSSDIWTVTIETTAVVGEDPASGDPMWLAMYYEHTGKATVDDGAVPVQLKQSTDNWTLLEATCSDGFVVGFERVDDRPDGTIAASWAVSVEHEETEDDGPTITIVEE